jgi:Mrp family chromosome partitioning ATPase
MGRMLETLKRKEQPNPSPEQALLPPVIPLGLNGGCPEVEREEPVDEEMPFVEVGGPRKPVEPKPQLEKPGLRPASLKSYAPQSVALQSCPLPTSPVPHVSTDVIVFHQPEHVVSKQYASMFGQLPNNSANGAAPVLVFTALTAGAGTTTAVLNLAVAGCKQHCKRICVVDANRNRTIAAGRLGVTAVVGLHDVLAGRVALEQAIHTTPIEGLSVLPGGTVAETGYGNADAVRWVLAWLGQRFDYVLVDAPSWDEKNALDALLSVAEAVYLVVDVAEAEKPQVRALTREAARLGSRLAGLIVTR